MIVTAVGLVLSYLVGSIPFSFLAGKMHGVDLRTVGSGNLGATNTFRALGSKVALVVLILDALKGVVAPLWFAHLPGLGAPLMPTPVFATACGVAAILGHMFPLYLHFKGGKGIATSMGVFGALEPWPLLLCFVIFWLAFGLSRGIVSLGSLLSTLALPIAMYVMGTQRNDLDWSRLGLATGLTLVIWMKHRSNLARLLAGQEKSVFAKDRAAPIERSNP